MVCPFTITPAEEEADACEDAVGFSFFFTTADTTADDTCEEDAVEDKVLLTVLLDTALLACTEDEAADDEDDTAAVVLEPLPEHPAAAHTVITAATAVIQTIFFVFIFLFLPFTFYAQSAQ